MLRFWTNKYDLPRWLRKVVGRLDDWYYEIRNRFVAKYYRLDIEVMPRGAWWDADCRVVHVVFQTLVNFVEQEWSTLGKYIAERDNHMVYQLWKERNWFRRWRERNQWNRKFAEYYVVRNDDDNEKLNLSQGEKDGMAEQRNADRRLWDLYVWYLDDFVPSLDEGFFGVESPPKDGVKYAKGLNPLNTVVSFTPEYMEWITRFGDYEDNRYRLATEKAQEILSLRGAMWT